MQKRGGGGADGAAGRGAGGVCRWQGICLFFAYGAWLWPPLPLKRVKGVVDAAIKAKAGLTNFSPARGGFLPSSSGEGKYPSCCVIAHAIATVCFCDV